ncbi:MAG TPA: glycosyl hydrolase family 57 [Kiritimatiellia bacterium]|nr:glycosyl hydrolase family 57 [Kiritimatiellia bacterium]
MNVLQSITDVQFDPATIDPQTGRNQAFAIRFRTDAPAPFPQVILRGPGGEWLFNRDQIRRLDDHHYEAAIPAGFLIPGGYQIQVESCRLDDPGQAGGGDWIKAFSSLTLEEPPKVQVKTRASRSKNVGTRKIYFGIHKHMHQPYYDTVNPGAWDGEKDGIFGTRKGAYSEFVADAIQRYVDGGLPHAGLSTSWSGTLIEQLDRCGREGLCGGGFAGWAERLRAVAQAKTTRGNPRLNFSAFGFFHPLMPLIPHRNIVEQIKRHREIIESTFGIPASRVLFPPETAFHVRMIPALVEAGIEAVIYDSHHRARAVRNYPYAGKEEGMLPPNPAEQMNDPVHDWYQLKNVWAGSKISPGTLRPEYVGYTDPDGVTHKIIAVPAERYLGNEDARGGFGALQYPDCFGQLYRHLEDTDGFDPKHPPFFLLHSDGDNYGGGTDSYYRHNTERLVEWLQQDDRFELTTVEDYLEQFPPDPNNIIHIEPGSWAGADNGDPQFMKWFSRYRDAYSPDLNSWAVLTALQNLVFTLRDAGCTGPAIDHAERLMLTAETSCYWYWTGQDVWDAQVTRAANAALHGVQGELDRIHARGLDRTGPTIFPPWVLPENPGGQMWGQGGLIPAPREAVLHCFVADVSGVGSVRLVGNTEQGELTLLLKDNGPYPSATGPGMTARLFTVDLPPGAGLLTYCLEADDEAGNTTRSSLERIYLG